MAQDSWRVLDIKTLSQSNDKGALQLLQQVAWQVQPIMRKRQWTVRRLSEFLPGNPSLLGLNVNRGAEVKIRLRKVRDGGFYDFNHVLGTMLHELVHIVHGPHNAAFYKLLDELWEEAEALMDKGVGGSGTGFDAPSVGRLGAHGFIPQHNPPEHLLHQVAAKAAEARARRSQLLLAGPQRLGGGGSSSWAAGLTPAQAAAAAAERRARDNLWCANGASQDPGVLEAAGAEAPREEEAGRGEGGSNSSSTREGQQPRQQQQQSLNPRQPQHIQQRQRQTQQQPVQGSGTDVAAGGAAAGLVQQQFEELVQQKKRARVASSSLLPTAQQQQQQQQKEATAEPGAHPLPARPSGAAATTSASVSWAASANPKAAAAAGGGGGGLDNGVVVVDLTADSDEEQGPLLVEPAATPTPTTAAAAGAAVQQPQQPQQQQQQEGQPSGWQVPAGRPRGWRRVPCPCCTLYLSGASTEVAPAAAVAGGPGCDAGWECPECTLHNSCQVLQCAVCYAVRPG